MRSSVRYSMTTLPRVQDHRGALSEFLRADEMGERGFRHVYCVTFDGTGVIRGNHYHARATECFAVVMGVVEVALEDLETGEKERLVLRADDAAHTRITLYPRVAHGFRSVSDRAMILAAATEPFVPHEDDRHAHPVIGVMDRWPVDLAPALTVSAHAALDLHR